VKQGLDDPRRSDPSVRAAAPPEDSSDGGMLPVPMARSYVAEQVYYFDSSPARVFQGLTDSETLVQWFLSKAEIEPTRGGVFHFEWIGGYRMDGRVLGFVRNKSVAFLWTDQLPSGRVIETRASFQVVVRGKGTLLKLRHSGFTDPEHFAECSARWAYYLTNMKSVLEYGTDLRSELDW